MVKGTGVTDKFRRMIKIIESIGKIQAKRERHQEQLADLDTKLADLGVEWADITKELSDDISITLPPSFLPSNLPSSLPPALPPAVRSRPRALTAHDGSAQARTQNARKRTAEIFELISQSRTPLAVRHIVSATGHNLGVVRSSIRQLLWRDKKIIMLGNTKNATYKVLEP